MVLMQEAHDPPEDGYCRSPVEEILIWSLGGLSNLLPQIGANVQSTAPKNATLTYRCTPKCLEIAKVLSCRERTSRRDELAFMFSYVGRILMQHLYGIFCNHGSVDLLGCRARSLNASVFWDARYLRARE